MVYFDAFNSFYDVILGCEIPFSIIIRVHSCAVNVHSLACVSAWVEKVMVVVGRYSMRGQEGGWGVGLGMT